MHVLAEGAVLGTAVAERVLLPADRAQTLPCQTSHPRSSTWAQAGRWESRARASETPWVGIILLGIKLLQRQGNKGWPRDRLDLTSPLLHTLWVVLDEKPVPSPPVRANRPHASQGNASGLEWGQLRLSLLNPESGFGFRHYCNTNQSK